MKHDGRDRNLSKYRACASNSKSETGLWRLKSDSAFLPRRIAPYWEGFTGGFHGKLSVFFISFLHNRQYPIGIDWGTIFKFFVGKHIFAVYCMEYKLLINGEWTGSGPMLEVKNKYNGSTVGAVPTASREDLNRAIEAAESNEDLMADMPAYKRAEILLRISALLRERSEDIAQTIVAEAGKALKFVRVEVERAAATFTR